MAQVEKLLIFLASPGDVPNERRYVQAVIEELNRTVASSKDLMLQVVSWETNTYPGFGQDAQALINQQIAEMARYSLFVGIMWNRLGTPTPRAASGTVEEFERAVAALGQNGQPEIWFYFRQAPAKFDSSEELEQRAKVLEFKEQVKACGMPWDYKSPSDFQNTFRNQVIMWLNSRDTTKPVPKHSGHPPQTMGTGLSGTETRISDTVSEKPNVKKASAWEDDQGKLLAADPNVQSSHKPEEENEKKRSWYRRTPVIVALIPALGALLVAFFQFVLPLLMRVDPPPKEYTVAGVVVDELTTKAIKGTKVSLEARGLPTVIYTDSEGAFSFSLSPDVHQVKIRVDAHGYVPFEKRINVSTRNELQDVRLTPTLVPSPTPTPTPPKSRNEPISQTKTPKRQPSPSQEEIEKEVIKVLEPKSPSPTPKRSFSPRPSPNH